MRERLITSIDPREIKDLSHAQVLIALLQLQIKLGIPIVERHDGTTEYYSFTDPEEAQRRVTAITEYEERQERLERLRREDEQLAVRLRQLEQRLRDEMRTVSERSDNSPAQPTWMANL